MREIYIDSSYKAYPAKKEGCTPLTVDMLDGFCSEYIEGLIVVPDGRTATHPDGRILNGPTVSPWKNSREMAAAQAQYERDQAELAAAYQEGVNSV